MKEQEEKKGKGNIELYWTGWEFPGKTHDFHGNDLQSEDDKD